MNKTTCKDCQYYYQHYGFNKQKIFRLYCGHCTLPHVRRKLPDAPACNNFVPGAPDEEAFATKEYLSKELLQYLLRLELLPEIVDACAPPRRKARDK